MKMSSLVFKAADVRRVVEHSLVAPKQGRVAVDYDPEGAITKPAEAPSVLLVHDQGIYLMSNGEPRDVLEGTERSYVAYAAGCDPGKDEDWWERGDALVGGDDFGEVLPWAHAIKRGLDMGVSHVVILFSGNKIGLAFRGSKRKAVA